MKATNLKTYLGTSVSLLVVLLMLCVGMAEGAEQVKEEWVARYNSSGNDLDYGTAIALDASGNVYVTGGSYSRATYTALDCATIKYDSAGNQLWVARYNGSGNVADEPSAIALDKSGNVYITVYCDADGWSTSNLATIKYDSAGNQLWVNRYNGPGNDQDNANGIAVDASGNIYVTGTSFGSNSFEDYATIKYDPNGNRLWIARYNGSGDGGGIARDITLDAPGNVYVTGSSYSSSTLHDYATIKYS